MVDRAKLMDMNKEQLVDAVDRAVEKAKSYKDKAVAAASEIMDYLFAAAGAGAVGYWLGSIQRKIDAGEEGYDEESLKFFGADKDLAAGVAIAVASNVKQLKKWKQPLRTFAMGSLSFWAGRKSFEVAYEMEEDEE